MSALKTSLRLFVSLSIAAIASSPAASAQGCPADDIYSPNHTCGTARQIGSAPSLIAIDLLVANDRPDYFLINRDISSNLYVRVEFDGARGNVDLALFRDDQCDVGPPLASSTGTGDVEVIAIPSEFDSFLRISRSGGPGDCSAYRLWIMQERNTTLGGTVCAGGSNSTGWSASITAAGSLAVADNNFRLTSGFLPLDSFGHFFNSTGVGYFMPAGSQGTVCINSGGIGRFIRPGEILNSGNQGFVTLPVDLTDIPRPTGLLSVLPGDSLAFQYWYRDTNSAGQAVSNFSAAALVWFE